MNRLMFAMALCGALALPATLVAAPKDAAAATANPKSQSPDTTAFDKNLAQFQEQMKIMHEQMDRIGKTQDPQEREKLLQEHWATMQNAMQTMHGMWGPGMMGPGMMGHGAMGPGMMGPGMMGGAGGAGGGWGHMGGYYSRLTPEQLRKRQYMTEQYLRMQQEMMNNMMWQQQYRTGPTPPSAK